jgi:uncharacterized membrane protein YccF (DUF307 family)
MLLFIIPFVVLAMALPLMGEVWRHPADNLITRGREEASILLEDAREHISRKTDGLAERLIWLRLIVFFLAVLEWILGVIIKIAK